MTRFELKLNKYLNTPMLSAHHIYSGICSNCENFFWTLDKNHQNCSSECKYLWIKNKRNDFSGKYLKCLQCGKEIYFNKKRAKVLLKEKKEILCSHSHKNPSPSCRKLWLRNSKNEKYRGKRKEASGYIAIRVDGEWVLEHRHVLETILKRKLKPFESIHHKNGIRSDNRKSNLELWTKWQPSGQRAEDLLDFIVKNYSKELILRLKK